MKHKILVILTLILLNSCSNQTALDKEGIVDTIRLQTVELVDTVKELETTSDDHIIDYAEFDSDLNEIPPNGKYLFDIAFAEWQGKSMGVKVTVMIKDDTVKVIYEGHGALTAEIGEVLDEGVIMKHKSGEWIIGAEPSDKELDEISGCTGGPAIIDFKNKKYWMC